MNRINIIQAVEDKKLFRSFFQDKKGSVESWANWMVFNRLVYGLEVPSQYEKLVLECTGRPLSSFEPDGIGFQEVLAICGRRSGKSRDGAAVVAFEALFAGKENLLSPGEYGLCACIAPTQQQAMVEKRYLRSIFRSSTLLEKEVRPTERKDSFELSNGVVIEVLVGDWRTVRNFTLIACIVTEAAFFGLDAESRVRSDSELIKAIKPSLATTNGKLVIITSPYAPKGYCYETWKRHWGNPNSKVLVWRAPTIVMNPLIDKSIIEQARAEDPAMAASEWDAQWREDVQTYLPREIVESVVVKGRFELLPQRNIAYSAFCDVSGGVHDDAALAVGHLEGETPIVDFAQRYKPPHSPQDVVCQMSGTLRLYRINHIMGDYYSAEWVVSAFKQFGIVYEKCPLNKSELYLEILPRLCSPGGIELLDDPVLTKQFASLQRRSMSGGRQVIDHTGGAHDDLCNVVSGVSYVLASRKRRRTGAFLCSSEDYYTDGSGFYDALRERRVLNLSRV